MNKTDHLNLLATSTLSFSSKFKVLVAILICAIILSYMLISFYFNTPIIPVKVADFVSSISREVKYSCINSAIVQIKNSASCSKYVANIENIKNKSCFRSRVTGEVSVIIKDARKNNCIVEFYE